MNKKAWYTFRIVLGGYLAWLGIRMLIEMVNEKPNNMVFMCVMSVIFILIGLAYAIYYVKKMFDLKKEDHRIEEEDKEAFDAGKDQADRKRRKNVLPEIGPNEEMKKEAEQGKTDKETAQSGNNIEKEAEKLDDKAEGETAELGRERAKYWIIWKADMELMFVRWMKWQSDWKKEEKYVSGKSWTGSEKRSSELTGN